MLENVDRTYLVLASGKLVLPKKLLLKVIDPILAFKEPFKLATGVKSSRKK